MHDCDAVPSLSWIVTPRPLIGVVPSSVKAAVRVAPLAASTVGPVYFRVVSSRVRRIAGTAGGGIVLGVTGEGGYARVACRLARWVPWSRT